MARGTSRASSEDSRARERLRAEVNQRADDLLVQTRTAATIAERVHGDQQKRRDGSPYMNHIREVVAGVTTPEARIAAYLHDTMEDGGITVEQLRAEGISEPVIEAVKALTMPPPAERGMSYQEHIERIVKPNRIATEVKIADLKSNLKDNDNPGQVKRYERALKTLQGE
jgi:(p)ppGpp synthase/HD superfamily hydrolase